MKYFTEDHEWVDVIDNEAVIGITDHAQAELGDIVFVDLPGVGDSLSAGDEVAVVESVKAAGEVRSPLSGEVIAINEALVDDPALVNQSAEHDGWIFRLRLEDPAQLAGLLDEEAYQALIG